MRHRLPSVAAGESTLAPGEQLHVARCLRCQAELAQHRRVGSALRILRERSVVSRPEALVEVRRALSAAGPAAEAPEVPGARRRRDAYVAGLVVATVAGAVGAAVVTSRSRRPGGVPRLAG